MSSTVLGKRKGHHPESRLKIARTSPLPTSASHILEIPSDFIMQFLEPNDRLPLAATCKTLLGKVEGFCERVFVKAVETSDESFQSRLEQESDLAQKHLKKDSLPFRLKLAIRLSIHQECLFENSIRNSSYH